MKYYLLNTILKDAIGVPTPVCINQNKIEDHSYYDKMINNYTFLEDSKPICLELTKWAGTPHKLRDYQYWGIGSPNAYLIVCSEKFRDILQNLNLPPYRIYNCEISVKNKIHNYFVLHFIQDWAKEIDYPKSVFNVIDYFDDFKIVKQLTAGEIYSYDNYEERRTKLAEIEQDLFPAKLHFPPHINCDVWGLQGQIILSEHAKQVIEEAGITGVDMPDIKTVKYLQNIEIVMSQPTQPLAKMVQYQTDFPVTSLVAEPEVKYGKV